MTVVAEDVLGRVAADLELREPNVEAVRTLAVRLHRWFEEEGKAPPFEGVIDAATGVGKTYILAAAIEYLAVHGHHNFAVICPGTTILTKTVNNFTNGHPKSLLDGMEVEPVVVTAEDFNTSAKAAAMEDDTQVKLFVFTVQALLKPTTELGRRTHKFQEGLGKAFYEHLDAQEDLIVFADEHHCYYGDKFSDAVRDLTPHALIGLTATPHKKTREDLIIYRYPLSAAIAEKLVKTPVLVGRKDDRADIETKLLDGINLLEAKERAIQRYCAQEGAKPVNPVMLVVAQTIDDAEAVADKLRSQAFLGGRYADHVLVVHSKKPDEDLAKLESVEDDDSPVRVIVSVGMLKEGWDVKNVYVIASLRSSISDILTEQTLGRGLRLPFGAYTDWELLDTLEVVAHERYADLLKKARVIKEQFIDYRTQTVVKRNAEGQEVVKTEEVQVAVPVVTDEDGGSDGIGPSVNAASSDFASPVIGAVEDRQAEAEAQLQAKQLQPQIEEFGLIRLPKLTMTEVENPFSLAKITDYEPFKRLGERLAKDPATELRRVQLSARIVRGPDGMRRTELVTDTPIDKVEATRVRVPLAEARAEMTERVLNDDVVPSRKDERKAVEPIIDAFLTGLGAEAEKLLSAYMDRAAAGLVRELREAHRRFLQEPLVDEKVELYEFAPTRTGRPVTSLDRRVEKFSRSTGYEGWHKSYYDQVWFDSGTERDLANLLDDAGEIQVWVRLHLGDLVIHWKQGNYNPDFLAIDDEGTRWVMEVKSDKEAPTPVVQGKRQAAQEWANHVSFAEGIDERWRYLLASETNIAQAKGDWGALTTGAGL